MAPLWTGTTTRATLPRPLGNQAHTRAAFLEFEDYLDGVIARVAGDTFTGIVSQTGARPVYRALATSATGQARFGQMASGVVEARLSSNLDYTGTVYNRDDTTKGAAQLMLRGAIDTSEVLALDWLDAGTNPGTLVRILSANKDGNLTVANSVLGQSYLAAGKATSTFGGSVRLIDDTGTTRWRVGIMGTAAAKDFVVHDLAAATTRLTINQSTGLVTIANALTASGLLTAGAAIAVSSGHLDMTGGGRLRWPGHANARIVGGSTDFAILNNAENASNLSLTDAGVAVFRNQVSIAAGNPTTQRIFLTSQGTNTAADASLHLDRSTAATHSQWMRFGTGLSYDIFLGRKANSDTLFIRNWNGVSSRDFVTIAPTGQMSVGLDAGLSAWHAQKSAIQVGLAGALSSYNNIVRMDLCDNSYESAADTWLAQQTAGSTKITLGGGSITFSAAPSVSAGQQHVWSANTVVFSSGGLNFTGSAGLVMANGRITTCLAGDAIYFGTGDKYMGATGGVGVGHMQYYVGPGQSHHFYVNSDILAITSAGMQPTFDNTVSMGTSGNRWTNVYAVSGTGISLRSYKSVEERINPAEAMAVVRATGFWRFRYKNDPEELLRSGFMADETDHLLSLDGGQYDPQSSACVAMAAIQDADNRLIEGDRERSEMLRRIEQLEQAVKSLSRPN